MKVDANIETHTDGSAVVTFITEQGRYVLEIPHYQCWCSFVKLVEGADKIMRDGLNIPVVDPMLGTSSDDQFFSVKINGSGNER